MERGAATRGKVADAVAGAEAIEIKATIPDHQVDSALARLGLTANNDEQRYIYFFDTPDLALLGAGIVARARRVVGDAHDCTVKFRPVNPVEVARKWRKYRDFKIEVDASETALVRAASFSMPVAKGLIKRVAQGQMSIAKIFSEAQETFLQTTAGRTIDLAGLAVLGPLMAQRWQVVDAACPWPITVELWRREDGRRLVEVSIKALAVQAAVAIGGFMAFLAELGVERDKEQQTKTRWALEYYVAKLVVAPVRKSSSSTGAAGMRSVRRLAQASSERRTGARAA
jgi:hypothetical protein